MSGNFWNILLRGFGLVHTNPEIWNDSSSRRLLLLYASVWFERPRLSSVRWGWAKIYRIQERLAHSQCQEHTARLSRNCTPFMSFRVHVASSLVVLSDYVCCPLWLLLFTNGAVTQLIGCTVSILAFIVYSFWVCKSTSGSSITLWFRFFYYIERSHLLGV